MKAKKQGTTVLCQDPEHKASYEVNGRHVTNAEARALREHYGFVLCVRCQLWRDKLIEAKQKAGIDAT